MSNQRAGVQGIVLWCLIAVLATVALLPGQVVQAATTYYVDYEGGDDAAAGTSPEEAFRHAPGDPQAGGAAAEVELQPGDTVLFKGGVVYRGGIEVKHSGRPDAPVVYDGNTGGGFGEGRAIIDGSEPIEGWHRLESAEEAGGNPNWENIYRATLPGETAPHSLILAQGERLLSLSRDPAAEDPFYIDEPRTMRRINPPRPEDRGRAAADPQTRMYRNRHHPYTLMFDGRDNTLAILDPMENARFDFHIPEARTVRRLAITTDSRTTRPREIAFLVDDQEILAERLPNAHDHFEFDLDAPVTFETLRFEVRSIYREEDGPSFGGIRRVQAFDADGNDVLRVIEKGAEDAHAAYADDTFFTQSDPDYWKGSIFAIHAGSNFIYYRRVLDYFPDRHKIHTEPIEVEQYPGDRGRFAMLNVLGAIRGPGEFYISPETDAEGDRYVYVWPFETGAEGPQGISATHRPHAFTINEQDHVQVTGFLIEKHDSGNAIEIRSSNHIAILGNEIRFGGGGAVGAARGENIRILDNNAHHNRGRGFRLHTVTNGVVSGNRLQKNGRTGIGLYVCRGMEMTYNEVTEHTGVHANALTVYAGSEDVLIEGNRSRDNNISLTLQDVENVRVRNNIFHSRGNVVGMWTGYHRDIRYEHNVLVGPEDRPSSDYRAGLFTNGDVDGLRVHNNILAGTSGRLPGRYSHNIYTRIGPNEDANDLPEASLHVPNLEELFRDPQNHDYRLQPESPARNAGIDLGVERDITSNSRPQGVAPDIGAYEFIPDPGRPD